MIRSGGNNGGGGFGSFREKNKIYILLHCSNCIHPTKEKKINNFIYELFPLQQQQRMTSIDVRGYGHYHHHHRKWYVPKIYENVFTKNLTQRNP